MNIGCTSLIVGMVVATAAPLTGYSRAGDPSIFRWFMGISFAVSLVGAGLRDK